MWRFVRHPLFRWWLAVAILGALGDIVPSLIWPSGNTTWVVSGAVLFLIGAVCGALYPSRPWQWAVAAVALVPIISIIPSRSLFGVIYGAVVAILPAIPVLAGAYVAAGVRSLFGRGEQGVSSEERLLWWLCFAFGVAASVPFFFSRDEQPPNPPNITWIWWMAAIFGVAFGMGLYRPARAARWAVGVGMGLPFVDIARIIVDEAHHRDLHNLLPIEIWFMLILSMGVSLAGAGIGWLLRQPAH